MEHIGANCWNVYSREIEKLDSFLACFLNPIPNGKTKLKLLVGLSPLTSQPAPCSNYPPSPTCLVVIPRCFLRLGPIALSWFF